MSIRTIPIRRVCNRPRLFMGGDRELVMFSALLAGILVFAAQNIFAAVIGIAIWFLTLRALRLMAKNDPLLRFIYLRHIRYKKYYAAKSTPFCDFKRRGDK